MSFNLVDHCKAMIHMGRQVLGETYQHWKFCMTLKQDLTRQVVLLKNATHIYREGTVVFLLTSKSFGSNTFFSMTTFSFLCLAPLGFSGLQSKSLKQHLSHLIINGYCELIVIHKTTQLNNKEYTVHLY